MPEKQSDRHRHRRQRPGEQVGEAHRQEEAEAEHQDLQHLGEVEEEQQQDPPTCPRYSTS